MILSAFFVKKGKSELKYFNEIIEEVKNLGENISEPEVQEFIQNIIESKHIFLAGAGRSGLVIRSFANRLLHLGFSVSIVGEISSPHTQEGDLLIISSGSGETPSLINQAKIAKKENVRIALITANDHSTLADLANYTLVIPAQTKDSLKESLQPMGTLFEQTNFFLYDNIVLLLMEKLGENNETMKKRHANLE